MTTQAYDKFKQLLAELFMFDQADLDFGIYRIMNAKRDEITRFLDNDLLPQVKDALGALDLSKRAEFEAELEKAVKAAAQLGVSPDASPRVQDLRRQLGESIDLVAAEEEIFSNLYNFFRRYYDAADFISQRRYKPGVYAIPYEGEEVKLHWANADQYYIKSAEYFRDYAFRLTGGRLVHFKVVSADTDISNNKSANGQDRRFLLATADPVAVVDGELVIRFEYRSESKSTAGAIETNEGEETDQGKKKVTTDQRNIQTAQTIMSSPLALPWVTALASPSKNSLKTVLEWHLAEYTARNKFDYFVHKDLGSFLSRELDFFVKNEVVHLDDLDSETTPRVDQYLAKAKAIRRIAHKLIDFLAQLENFQKKLWLKKKFITETNYCITVDRIPRELHAEIVANKAQADEWFELLKIGSLPSDIFGAQINRDKLSADVLQSMPSLVVDTRHFDEAFRNALVSSLEDRDEALDGLLIQGDNAHALRLIGTTFKNRVRCAYIDPPYNRGGDDFNYKDNYQHSSWLTMIRERLAIAHPLLMRNGVIFVSIDENERADLEHALSDVFGQNNRVEELIWVQNTTHSQSPTYSTNHEYVEVFAKDKLATMREAGMYREPKPGYVELQDLVAKLNPEYPPIAKVELAIQAIMMQHLAEYKEELAGIGLQYDAETKKQDPWRGIYSYTFAEYRDATERLVPPSEARANNANLVIWTESDASMPAAKQSDTTKDPNDPNFRFYKPPHPITGKPCPHPKTGWRMPYTWPDDSRESFDRFAKRDRIVWGKDEAKVPRYKRFLHEVETNVAKSVIHDYTDGEKQVADLFGRPNAFPNPKPSTLIQRFVMQTCSAGDYVMDFFAGSGTTFQATWEASEKLRKPLRFIASDMGEHFDDIMLPRLKKLMFSKRWNDGLPREKEGRSSVVKYMRLESYEDTLNNLRLKPRTFAQQSLLDGYPGMREDYILRYMLNVESNASLSLLSVDRFEDPFNYTMQIATGTVGETRPVTIDLVETFNYLIGLHVRRVIHVSDFRVVEGYSPNGKNVLVIWRNTKDKSNSDLDIFFQHRRSQATSNEVDVIYINGDNNLQNLRQPEEHWEVKLIEEEFQRLMFDVRDV